MTSCDVRLRASKPGAAGAGVGLKPAHFRTILETRPPVGFFEVHAENYMGAGGPPHRFLESIRADYPLSVHGVGLSIGSGESLDPEHLARLKRVVVRYEPALVSEHLAWSSHRGFFLNDLLPLPYTRETLALVCAHVNQVQDVLQRKMLLENPSTYVRFDESTFTETQFLEEIVARTGCGLLLDVNNVMVSATNQAFAPRDYLDAFPVEDVEEIHLAGFAEERGDESARLLIDDHGSAVRPEVWSLYRHALSRTGAVPTLIEWDNDVPEWALLLAESLWAAAMLADLSAPKPSQAAIHASSLA